MDTPNETDPAKQEPEASKPEVVLPEGTRLMAYRPWLAPMIASGVLLLVILLLLIPNVLLFPRDATINMGQQDPETVDEIRQSLEARAEELRDLLASDVCIADGRYTFRDPALAEANGVTEESLRQSTMPSLNAPVIRPPVDSDGDGVPDPDMSDTPPAANTPEDALGNLLDSAVVLVIRESVDPDARSGTGSGFFISDNLIVTNGHVVGNEGDGRITVVNRALGSRVPVEVVASTGTPANYGSPDFALLRLAEPVTGVETLDLATTPSVLSWVVAAGFPGVMLQSDEEFEALRQGQAGRVPVMLKWSGTVLAHQNGAAGEIIVHSAQITPGNSGGPTVDMCGRVAGVNTFLIQDETTGAHIYKALNASMLQTWLSQQGISLDRDSTACNPAARFQTAPAP